MNFLLRNAVDTTLVLTLALAAMPLLRRQSAALRHLVLAAFVVTAAVLPLAAPWLPQWRVPVPLAPPAQVLTFAGTVREAPAAPSERAAVEGVTPAESATSLAALVLWAWAAGAVVGVAALSLGFLRLLRLSSGARRITRETWVTEAESIRREMGLARPVALLESRDPRLLVVWGARTPRVLLPPAAREWPQARIRIVLYHELSHIRRGDWLVQCVAELLRAVYWFNPLTWATCARLRRESDHAADDAVLNRGIEGPDYASHLVDIAHALRERRRWAPALAMAHRSGFEQRVKAMLNEQINRRPLSTLACAITLATCIAVAVPIVAVTAAEQALAQFTGQVLDPTNAVLPGAVITLTNTQTKLKYEVTTNREGRYEIPGVPPGAYVLESRLPGFATLKWDVTVTGQNIDRDLRLELGSLQETITVGVGAGWGAPKPKDPGQDARIEAYKKKLADQEANCAKSPVTTGPKIGGNIRVPVKLRDVRPIYPPALASNGVSGKAVLDTEIGPDGTVQETRVLSTTHPEFADALIEAVKQWQFSSTLLNCQAMVVKMTVTGNFEYRP